MPGGLAQTSQVFGNTAVQLDRGGHCTELPALNYQTVDFFARYRASIARQDGH